MAEKREYRSAGLNKRLQEIASAAGYTPCEFTMQRLSQDAEILRGWRDDIDHGLTPADFTGMSLNDAGKIVRKEIAAFIERERQWAPFFYPTMKSTEVSGPGGGPIEISGIDVVFRDADEG